MNLSLFLTTAIIFVWARVFACGICHMDSTTITFNAITSDSLDATFVMCCC